MYTVKLHGSPVKWATLCSLIKKGLRVEAILKWDLNQGSCLPGFFSLQHAITKHEKLTHAHPPPPKLLWLCFCCVGMHRNAQSLLVSSLYPYCFVFVPSQSSCLIEQRFQFTTVGFIFRGIPKGASLLRIKYKDVIWGFWKAN